ncbi:MAG: tRNA 4-thiouridine(8) synthase ThiI [Clostridia bacterium]|nr:tRNA 4-thiouridine(8) synthase ThiI [Clostridia bacterium]
MEKVVLIRYGEIFLKGKNRNFFENTLENNIKNALISVDNVNVAKIPGRFMVSGFGEFDEDIVINKLKKIAGIYSFSPAVLIETQMEEIISASIDQLSDEQGTFKVVTNRADKSFPLNSMEISRLVGGRILSANRNLKVDVINPQHILNIDVRENKRTYIFTKTIKGIGGMPVGCSGKGLLLLSGGIDSPVAGFMMAKRGAKLYALHFHSFPYTSELARLKVEELSQKIAEYNAGELTVFMCSMTKYQEMINRNCNPIYNITLLRRAMFTVAERLCKEKGIDMIISGENLGQVASQTIESMTVVSNVVKDIPIMRPLIAFDKQETIDIARQIDTYDISIRPYEDCCTIFVPDNPVTRPKLFKVEAEEKKLDFDKLVDESYETMETVVIKAR